jgi:crotonobetainyl-CoA:carnitine CoA-transferase CaiB-like acyl-CoA transferase
VTGPLEGIVVADFSRVLSGPWSSMTLGDLGAEVIKVEHPEGGDETRGWGPPFVEDVSAYFLSTNRNKKSLRLDLRNTEDQQIAERLVARADVLIENFRPGTIERLGLGEQRCRELNPDIVYCSISGFGRDSNRPGYDAIVQGVGGIMSITGPAGGEPVKVGVAIADIATGLYATIAILAALFHRERTGQGQVVESTLIGAQLALLANQASNTLNAGVAPGRLGTAHPSIVPYQGFEASDASFMLAVANEPIWRRFSAAIDRNDLAADPRFESNSRRVANRDELLTILKQIFATRSRADWLTLFDQAGVPAGPINSLQEAFADPVVRALDLVQEISHPSIGSVSGVRFPVDLSATPAAIRAHPPALGEHDAEVLRWLEFDEAAIEAHRERNAHT